ncbi:MAG: S1 family peptidase [Firmicutes bacterium]|nr:S1 family peptidase [Bacillota bacterium]
MKKLLKKLLMIMLMGIVAVSFFGFSLSVENIEMHETQLLENEEMEFSTNLEKSMLLFDDVISNFRVPFNNAGIMSNDGVMSFNEYVYCDDFAGVWYCEDGFLNIGVMNSRRSRNSNVRYHAREFSFNFLNSIRDVVCDLMPTYTIHGVGIAPQYNKVVITLSNENYIENIISYLSDLVLLEENAINFVVAEKAVFTSRPIHGGEQIFEVGQGTVNVGSLGAKAFCNQTGRRGVITNEHVAPRGTLMRHGTTNVGTSFRTQFGGTADAAFIPFDNPNDWQFRSSASYFIRPNRTLRTVIPKTYMVASRNDIQVGLPVAQFGNATGRTDGEISQINASFWIGSWLFGTRFTDQILSTAYTSGGDSGGPLFITAGGRYILAGLHFANRDADENGANKITNVQQALDVTILTECSVFSVGTHQISSVSRQSIHLTGNNTSFDVVMYLSNGQTRSFSVDGHGISTTGLFSQNIPLLNGGVNFNEARIVFHSTLIDVVMPNNSHIQRLTPSLGGVVTFVRINVRRSGVHNIITGNNVIKLVENAQQLYNIRHNPTGNFRLVADIDLSVFSNWTPIPNFWGRFENGNRHYIRNMRITGRNIAYNGQAIGLFAINRGRLYDIRLRYANIYFGWEHDSLPNQHFCYNWADIGAVAGRNYGFIGGAVVQGRMEVHRQASALGGIAGRNMGRIQFSAVSSAYFRGNGDIGGIVGVNYHGGDVFHCHSYNTAIRYWFVHYNRSVGGIVGFSLHSRIELSRVFGAYISIVGTNGALSGVVKSPWMGQIVGFLAHSTMWSVHADNMVILSHGILQPHERANVGASRHSWGWEWGGNYTPDSSIM